MLLVVDCRWRMKEHGCKETLNKLWYTLEGVVAKECYGLVNLKCLVVWRSQKSFPEGLVTMCTTSNTLQTNQD